MEAQKTNHVAHSIDLDTWYSHVIGIGIDLDTWYSHVIAIGIDLDSWYKISTPKSHTYERAKCCL